MLDAIVAGAGPAGSIAAIVLARAGARVLVIDRETFPRHKLCGDTLNPGALNFLGTLKLDGGPIGHGVPLNGMTVTGPRASVSVRYGDGCTGRAISRYELDLWLLEEAIRAGAKFESAMVARQPLMAEPGGSGSVRGLVIAQRGRPEAVSRIPAAMVVAADGARSALGRALGLVSTPRQPRRWAFGAYVAGVEGVDDLGEMHVRGEAYVGIVQMPDGRANVCVVTARRFAGRGTLDVMQAAIAQAGLAARFRRAVFDKPRVLGPLASDVTRAGTAGLLLAGDAAGFIDPMTGDGLHLAMRGAVLAAEETLHALDTADMAGAPRRLAAARDRVLGHKLRFNRVLRSVAASPFAIGLLSYGAILAPGFMRPVVRYAGDVPPRGSAA